MNWTYVVSDKRAGTIPVVSPNTEESYEISQWGTWVPAVDVEELLKQERDVCCGAGGLIRIKVFGRGNPTVDQMKKKPLRTPRYKFRPRRRRRS